MQSATENGRLWMLIHCLSAGTGENGIPRGDPLSVPETDADFNHQTRLIAVLTDPEKGRQRI